MNGFTLTNLIISSVVGTKLYSGLYPEFSLSMTDKYIKR